jgi:branched-chain amino acid transport system permease protein
MLFSLSILNGLTLAALLVIIASGLTLSFSLMRVVNLTHGAFYLLAGFIGFSIYQASDSWILGLFGASVGIAVLALLQERTLLQRGRGNDLVETLISLSIAIILGDVIQVIWGGFPQRMSPPEFLRGSTLIPFIGTPFPKFRIFVIVVAVVLLCLLWLLLKKTNLGIRIRAGVDDFQMTEALGINVGRVFTLVFALSGFLAGIGGMIGGTYMALVLGEDWRILTLTLVVIIIGGLGSLKGTVAGALVVGLVYSISSAYVPVLSGVLLFLPVAVVLTIRPQGLFGKEVIS